MSPGEMNFDPMEREFFGDEPINTRLARESIQNSLDAAVERSSSQPVKMRFSLAGIHSPLPVAQAAPYLTGLIEHLEQVSAEHLDEDITTRISGGDLATGGVPFLVIEDAGTQGLTGSWEQFDDSELQNETDDHFYWFFRNIGRSGKGDSDNGSWGLGKWVFPDASRVSAYIAVTKRQSDDETLLIGQSILTKHTIDGQRFEPYGFLGISGENGLQLPIVMSNPEQRPLVERCLEDFGIQLRGQPGLSVIVLFPRTNVADDETISASGLLSAIVRNYFYPIIDGRLEITVEEGDGSLPVTLNSDTIDTVVKNLGSEDDGELSVRSYTKLLDMCRKCITLPRSEYTTLSDLQRINAGDTVHTAIADLRDRYNAGELLAFRILGEAQRRKETRQPTEFNLYLQRDDSLPYGHDYYVRGTLSISDMDHIRRHRSWSLLKVDERNPLAAMLRDSEPAAHTSWRPQTRRVQERWVAPRPRIQTVLRSPATILGLLEAPPEGLQKDVFSDIFFLEKEESTTQSQGQTRERSAIYGQGKENQRKRRRDFAVSRVDRGFRIALANGSEEPPARAKLEVGYVVPRGNPVKSYRPEDFRLHGRGAELALHFGGCQVRPGRAGNELFLEIDNPDEFELTVTGFDPLRDLLVNVNTVSHDGETGDGSS